MEDVVGIKNPRVAIVNIGAEEEKGNALVKETFPLLKECPGINFIGSIEARDIPAGYADVIAVSYTHLDVYKRQVLGLTTHPVLVQSVGNGLALTDEAFSVLTVQSYGLSLDQCVTVDVYKRQDTGDEGYFCKNKMPFCDFDR